MPSRCLLGSEEGALTSFLTLRAAISSADIGAACDIAVGVSGSSLPAVTFRVVERVTRVLVPATLK